MKKPYSLIAGDAYPSSGTGDWVECYSSVEEARQQIEYEDDDFYKPRLELLQKVQKYMRDPERQIVCDILANNSLLPDPSGVRYGQDLRKIIGIDND